MRYLTTVLLGTAASAVLAVAASADTVRIGTARDPNLASQIIIAEHEGLFAAEGLEAEVTYFPSGGDLMAAVAGGSVDFGSSGSTPTTILKSRPFPLKIVAQMADISGAQQLVAAAGIDSLADLEGQPVGLLMGTGSEALLASIVADHGMEMTDFELVNLGPSEMVQALVQGQIQAAALWEPLATRATMVSDAKKLQTGTIDYSGGGMVEKRVYGDHSVLFSTEDYLAENPETTQAVLKALMAAGQFMVDSPEETTAILAETFNFTPEQMNGILSANEYTLRIDSALVSDLDALADFLAARDKLAEQVPAESWIDTGPLEAVSPDMVALDG